MLEPVIVAGASATLDVQYAVAQDGLPAAQQMLAWVEAALEAEQRGVELVIRLVDEAESAELNETYRGKPGPTNVLSFPFDMPPEVEEARLLIDRWFYPCSRAMHASLGEMYVADARFTATYEAIRPSMARYLRDATAANAARGEG